MNNLMSFLPLLLIVVFFYFFVIRPQNKQQKEIKDMRSTMKVGDEVLTIGGFYGVIYAIDDQNVVLEMLPDFNKAMVVKSAISKVITESDKAEEDNSEDKTTAADDNQVEDAEVEEIEVETVDEEPADETSETKEK
ncbi:MAG: preprotein translocase subunit YajC [Eubacteriaceae bacterium]|jgi:preprotein translocase subunit YajC